MPSPGKALLVGDAYLFAVDDMIGRADVPDTVADDLVNDYAWATSVFPAPIVIDYTWLAQPLSWRPVPPVNSQSASRTGGSPATVVNTTSSGEYTVFAGNPVTLDTALDADPPALATHAVTWQPNWLQRPPVLTVDLMQRTTAERWRILSATEGSRLILANTPADWPTECVSVFVDGITHVIGLDARLVAFACAPLIGQAAGQVGPWFMADRSMTGGSDASPF